MRELMGFITRYMNALLPVSHEKDYKVNGNVSLRKLSWLRWGSRKGCVGVCPPASPAYRGNEQRVLSQQGP